MTTPQEILQDPATPYWARDLVKLLLTKDPVDVANTLEVLAKWFAERARSIR